MLAGALHEDRTPWLRIVRDVGILCGLVVAAIAIPALVDEWQSRPLTFPMAATELGYTGQLAPEYEDTIQEHLLALGATCNTCCRPPGDAVTVPVSWNIEANGSVGEISVSPPADEDLRACVNRVLGCRTFAPPQTTGPLTISTRLFFYKVDGHVGVDYPHTVERTTQP